MERKTRKVTLRRGFIYLLRAHKARVVHLPHGVELEVIGRMPLTDAAPEPDNGSTTESNTRTRGGKN